MNLRSLAEPNEIKIPRGYALKKKIMLFDGERFITYDKVKVKSDWVHQKVLHYARTTTCGLYGTSKIKTAGNFKDVSCPNCLEILAEKKSEELQIIETELAHQRKRL